MYKKILFSTVLFCSFSLTAYTEEYDKNLVAKQLDVASNKQNREDIVILKSNGNDDEVSVSLGEEDRVQDKDGYFKNEYTMSDKNLEEFRTFLKNNYDERYSKKIKVDNGYVRNKGVKFDIQVKETKKSKLGSTRSDLQHGYDAFMKKQYELAVMHYKKALSKNKNSIEAKFGLAVSYHMLKQYDQAIEFYTQLINKDFSRQKVVNNLFIALQHKTYNEALDILNDIDSRSAGYADILGQIGIFHIKTGDNIKAISALSKANELSPSNALVSYNLGYVYDLEKNHDYAKHFYEQAIRNNVSDVISSSDYAKLVKRIAELDKIIKEEIDKIVKNNKKQ